MKEIAQKVKAASNGLVKLVHFGGTKQKSTFQCAEGHKFKCRHYDIIRTGKCTVCSTQKHREICILSKGGEIAYRKKVRKKWGSAIQVVGEYQGKAVPIKHRCHKHGIYKTAPYNVIENAGGCKQCAADKFRTNHKPLGTEKYKARLKKLVGTNFVVLGEYVNINTKIEHRHTGCGNTIQVTPKSMLQNRGCYICSTSVIRKNSFRSKKVRIGTRVARVQGGEREAIKFLLGRGVDPKSLSVSSDKTIPRFTYQDKSGKNHYYYPDIMIGKRTIVEVKSPWFLGLRQKKFYCELRRKAREVRKEYTFKILVCSMKRHPPIMFNSNLLEMKHKDFLKYWIKTYKLNHNGWPI